jgi:hypothetical protein
MKHQMVRYRVKPDRVAENTELIRDVYAELRRAGPSGFRYATLRLDDGGTFVHIAVTKGPHNPLSGLDAFKRFRARLSDRVEAGPEASEAELIGAYGFD